VREFGTLKALGWRGRRIVAQVMGESIAIGAVGAALGVGIGYGGAAIINAIAPKLTGTLPSSSSAGQQIVQAGGGVARALNPTSAQTVSVLWTTTIDGAAIIAAVLLALAGGLIAGAFGSWRIGRLRPADALAKVG
jgi:putative ABC transport system permease protein